MFLKNKIQFIEQVINKEIIIFNNKIKYDDIEKQLITKNYEKFNDSYDYLLNLCVYDFTLEKIDKLNQKYLKKETELQQVINKSIEQMWIYDIDDFINCVLETQKREKEEFENIYNKTPNKKLNTGGKRKRNDYLK